MVLVHPRDYYFPKRWEGKNLNYKMKFLMANYTGAAISLFGVFIFCPVLAVIKYSLWQGSEFEAAAKYKPQYVVVRDNSKNIEKIMYEKELGRHLFPKFC